jgi:hypothetical protein
MSGMAVGGGGRKVVWVAATGALIVGALGYVLAGDHEPLGVSDRSGLVSMLAALPALVIAMIAALWAQPGAYEDEAAAVARLAREVRSACEAQWTQSLGGDLTTIDVAFTFRPYPSARAAELPVAPEGRLERVVEDYRAIRPQRLVITGEAGAGKTVLSRKVVMELLAARGTEEPVPVPIALADWDEEEQLEEWIVRHLESDYGMHSRSARLVMDSRMVLPVLDGLDEMDAADTPVDETRAYLVLETLARYQRGTAAAPLVLTCRTRLYDALETVGGHLPDAARIEIEPVTATHAVQFLERRSAARWPTLWRPVLDELRAQPGGVLAQALSTPWRLTLAATVFERGGEPSELTGLEAESDVADLLLSRYVEASRRMAPRRWLYQEDDIHRWLRTIAGQLGSGSVMESDVLLLELGVRTRRVAVRSLRWMVYACLAVLSVAPVWIWSESRLDALAWVNILLIPVLCVINALVGQRLYPPLVFGAPPLGSPLWGLGLRLAVTRNTYSWMFGVISILVLSAVPRLSFSDDPVEAYALALGWLATLGALRAASWVNRAACGPAGGIRCGILFGGGALCLGLMFIVFAGPSVYSVASVSGVLLMVAAMTPGQCDFVFYVLLNHGRVPLRLARFLDWAVAAGLMRTSGTAYQFRHREFQEWLVRHPWPTAGSTGTR